MLSSGYLRTTGPRRIMVQIKPPPQPTTHPTNQPINLPTLPANQPPIEIADLVTIQKYAWIRNNSAILVIHYRLQNMHMFQTFV